MRRDQDVIDINAKLPTYEVTRTPATTEAIDHYWNKDLDDIKRLRHQLYIKINQLTQYRHKSEAVQEAVYTLREAMITVNEAQLDLDRANT